MTAKEKVMAPGEHLRKEERGSKEERERIERRREKRRGEGK